MSYLSSTSVVVDAILTKKGRELLARNNGSFQITQFSLADDEIDYTLYNPNHPSGSAFYGEAIEAMPILQAYPNDTEIMRYKLITLPRGTAKIPVLDLGYTSITLKQGASLAITPQTLNYLGATSTFEQSGYTATIGDVTVGTTTPVLTIAVPSSGNVYQAFESHKAIQFFSTAIVIAATTGVADSDTNAPQSGLYVQLQYN